MLTLLVGMTGTVAVQAQNHVEKAKTTIAGKATKFWKDAKKSVKSTSTEIRSELGIESSDAKALRVQYMPIYRKNNYQGHDGETMIQLCQEDFYAHYQNASILYAVIPQKEWNSEPVKKAGKITGYLQTLYCYVLAKDGNDGYINNEYLFERYKDVGGTPEQVAGKWATRTRTDIITPDIYKKIKD